MRQNWDKRIRKLESILQSRSRSAALFRYGHLTRLPKDTVGERHIAIANSAATAVPHVEQCDFEERLGPAGERDESGFFVYLCSEDDNAEQS